MHHLKAISHQLFLFLHLFTSSPVSKVNCREVQSAVSLHWIQLRALTPAREDHQTWIRYHYPFTLAMWCLSIPHLNQISLIFVVQLCVQLNTKLSRCGLLVSVPDCGVRGPRFEFHHRRLFIANAHCDMQSCVQVTHLYCSPIQSSSSIHRYECVALCKYISLQKGWFCARSLASCIPRSSEDRSSWMFFVQAVHCCPRGRLQFSGGGLKMAWLASAFSSIRARCPNKVRWRDLMVDESGGWLVVWRMSAFLTKSCQRMSRILHRRHHWSTASVRCISALLTAQHSDP